MLAYVLALAVGLGSIALYLAAFFFPEIHRKNDFIWSGVGLFYALVLWIFAQRITGGLLLGHVASVALLGWFGWQTLSLRRQITPKMQQTEIPSTETVKTNIQQQVSGFSLPEKLAQLQKGIGSTFSGVKNRVQSVGKKTPEKSKQAPTAQTPAATGKPAVEIVDQRTPVTEQPAVTQSPTTDTEEKIPTAEPPASSVTVEVIPQDAVSANPPSGELIETAQADTETVEVVPPAEIPPNQVPPKNQAEGS
ncbi:Ycf66 family protein [Brasilonema sp. UFV-L1]|uniref:Ycf66 family protein n=1 Tax=Brasilonema sp. UFV-L1 TaxID=2234130 RepID=UPI00145F207D|nr:Ycf66 family protein [Brasilonema sp. UFV-L1]NMG09059.1 hypothetical protein [Brasilonema sp. UFV-L1]